RNQAGRIFAEMCAIIQVTPWMIDRISIRRHAKELEDIGGTGTVFAALSADVATKHGLSPSFIVYDELGQSQSRDLLDALDTATGARAEPLMVVISTQAARDDAPMSELIDYGLKVQAGEVDDPSFHMTLFRASEDADPWHKSTWKAANPALGDFRSLDDVERLARQARRMPSKEMAFRNLILNQRVDTTAQFISRAVWNSCTDDPNPKADGRRVFAGLDLSASRDLSALVLAIENDDQTFDIVPTFWLPDDDLAEREHVDRAPYRQWRDDGYLETSPGKSQDPHLIARRIAQLHGQYDIKALAYDRWRIEDLKRELDAIGCYVDLVPHGQGYRDMSPAIDVTERLLVEGALRHGGHPLLTWCASNAKATLDPAGNRKLDKSKATGRIDGMVAMVMALGAANRHEEKGWNEEIPLVISL
ncbi:MAG: terminase TerL endonuclease subunit, partial [Pseudomonadota bacterium]